MFTIKHVSPTGAESLYEAIEVNFTPAFSDQLANNAAATNVVWYTTPETKEIKSISNGRVYVTNEAGATVAKYDMARDPRDPNVYADARGVGVNDPSRQGMAHNY